MAKDDYVLGIDQSTQGTKALLFDGEGNLISVKSQPHRQIINDLGYVEHSLDEIAKNVIGTVKALVDEDPDRAYKIKCAGLSVQRETVGAWRRSTQRPLYHAVVWQCPRGAEYVRREEIAGSAQSIRDVTGLELSEYFSASKITWLMDHVPEIKRAACEHDLCIGHMDACLVSFLTSRQSFYTEPSNASRTQLMDLKTQQWSPELCRLFKVPIEALPPIIDSDAEFGCSDFAGVLAHKIPLHAAIGDSQGALFGHGCLKAGQTKTTYGTGSSIMMNAGTKTVSCPHGIVNSAAWRRQGRSVFVLEGNINYSAGIISYLKDDLKLISSAQETEAMAKAANPHDRCFFVPALSGLGAPYFNADVRGSILGMSRLTGKNEIVRAALDSIAFQVSDILALICNHAGIPVTELDVDGGATKNGYLMQTQSDLCRLKIKVPEQSELSGKGAAFMAGIAAGIYDEGLLLKESVGRIYTPQCDEQSAKSRLERWHHAVAAAVSYGI